MAKRAPKPPRVTAQSLGKFYKVSDEEIALCARFYNPLASSPENIANLKAAGYKMHRRRYGEIVQDPRFYSCFQMYVKQAAKKEIATIADVQTKVTQIMNAPTSNNMEVLKAAELMGRMLGAFNDKIKLEGQLQVIAGVITGVPERKEKSAEPVQPVDIDVAVNAEEHERKDN